MKRLIPIFSFLLVCLNFSYGQEFLEKGLIGYFPFDSTMDNQSDISLSRTNVGVSYDKGVFGYNYGAGYFDGSDVIYVADNDSLDIKKRITVAAWINFKSQPTAAGIMNKGDCDVSESFQFLIFNTKTINFVLNFKNQGRKAYQVGYNYSFGTWFHVAITYDGSKVRFYINGDLVSTQNSVNDVLVTNNESMRVGAEVETGCGINRKHYFNGRLDEVRLYRRSLSSSQIEALYEGSTCKFGIYPLDSNHCSKGTFPIEARIPGWYIDYSRVNYYWSPSSNFSNTNSRSTTISLSETKRIRLRTVNKRTQCLNDTFRKERIMISSLDFDSDTILIGDTLKFENNSVVDSTISTFFWDFGDGNKSVLKNPQHSYKYYGIFPVKLKVISDSICQDSVIKNIYVLSTSPPTFSYSGNCESQYYKFSNTTNPNPYIDSVIWVFNGVDRFYGDTISYKFSTPGKHNVLMILKSNNGYRDTAFKSIQINPNPKPGLSFTGFCENQNIKIKDKSSISSGRILTLDLDITGDGNYDLNNMEPGDSVIYSFSSVGTKLFKLRATSDSGCTTIFNTSHIIEALPESEFSYTPVCINDTTFFEDKSTISSGSIKSVLVDFENNGKFDTTNLSPGSVSNYIFGHTSNYSIHYKVISDKGCIDTAVRQVLTKATPIPNFSVLAQCESEPVQLKDLSFVSPGNNISAVSFDFENDGTFDTLISTPGDIVSNFYSTTGIKTVIVMAEADNGCLAENSKSFTLFPNPVPQVLASEACAGDATFFTDNSTITSGAISSIDFDFNNDGIYDRTGLGNGGKASYTYPSPGTKDITMRVTSSQGCITIETKKFSINKTVTVHPNPSIGFTANEACLGSSTLFEDTSTVNPGSIQTLHYDFNNDGVFDTTNLNPGDKFSFKFSSDGSKRINVYAITDQGCEGLYDRDINVKPNPEPEFTVTDKCENDTTKVINKAPGSGVIFSYVDYDFDNDGIFDTTNVKSGDQVSYHYSTFGLKTIVLRSTTTDGCRNSSSENFKFSPKPKASFSFNNNCLGIATEFIDSSNISIGSIAGYKWRFGDGGVSELRNPDVKYKNSGDYSVKLIAISGESCKDTANRIVKVDNLPNVAFTATDNCIYDTFDFKNNSSISSGGAMNYSWIFGDGDNSTLKSPSHEYKKSGTYYVKLIATSLNGCKDSLQKEINVFPSPVANFSAFNVCLGEEMNFNNLSTGGNNYTWLFGDLNSTSGIQPKHTYLTSDTFNVTLIAGSNSGCYDTFSSNVIVNPLPVASFSVNDACYGDTSEFSNLSSGATRFKWSFGDLSSSYSFNPEKIYVSPGNYNVDLISYSKNNCADTFSASAIVNALPQPDFDFSDVCDGDTVKLINRSVSGNFSWSLGDGSFEFSNDVNKVYSTHGEYLVTLKMTDGNGCVDSITKEISVNPNPVTAFQTANVCDGEKVSFSNNTTLANGIIKGYQWDFGDNQGTSTAQNPEYTYADSGTYNVSLIAISSLGCESMISKNVTIYPLPEVSFTAGDKCIYDKVKFSNNSTLINTSSWSFGDGKSSTSTNPVHRFKTYGTFNVTLKVTTSAGCSAIADKDINVFQQPGAAFSFTRECEGFSTEFNNSSVGAVKYYWDFGDSKGTSNSLSPDYLFASAGNYDVQLISENSNGCSDTLTHNVVVYGNPKSVFSSQNICLGEQMVFSNNSVNAKSYSWSFGDGGTSLQETPGYTFNSDGNYTVTLISTSKDGCLDTNSQIVTVYPLPVTSFSFNNVCLGKSVPFNNQTTGASSYYWDFGDGTGTSTSSSPSYKYMDDGNFDVKLLAVSNNGCKDSLIKAVEIYELPVALFTAKNECLDDPVNIINNSIGNLKSYLWNFGDSNISQTMNPVHKFSTSGTYEVGLIVKDVNECVDTFSDKIIVYPEPNIGFTASEECDLLPIDFIDTTQLQTGFVQSAIWSFGDGEVATGDSVSHLYPANGFYKVSLSVTSNNGCTGFLEKLIEVYPLPKPDFSATEVCFGEATEFISSSKIERGTIKGQVFKFGDGLSSQGFDLKHRYGSSGNYPVTLLAVSNQGCQDSITKNVKVLVKPMARFNANPVCYGDSMAFTNNSLDANSFNWDFGDVNGFSNKKSPIYLFLNSGDFTVTLYAFNNNGCSDTIDSQVEVMPLPNANFSIENVCFGQSLNPMDASTGSNLKFTWNFGNGNTLKGKDVSFTPEEWGERDIWLTVESGDGCFDSVNRVVNIYPLPEFSAIPDTVISKGRGLILDASINLDNPDNKPQSYHWTPELTIENPNRLRTFADPMEKTDYVLQVTSIFGCQNSDTVKVMIEDDYFLDVKNIFTPDGNGKNETFHISNIDAYEDCTVIVFDQYGREVFKEKAYQNDWDGSVNGKPLPDGTYYYYIKCSNSDRSYKGSVTILRNK